MHTLCTCVCPAEYEEYYPSKIFASKNDVSIMGASSGYGKYEPGGCRTHRGQVPLPGLTPANQPA